MKRSSFGRLFLLVSLLVMALSNGLVAAQEEQVPITIFRGGVSFDYENDPVVQAIEDRMNVDITFVTVPFSEVPQGLNLNLASGESIDIYNHMDTNPQWIEDGAIIPLESYINPEDHPYLTSVTSSPLFSSVNRDGHIYYIPMVTDGYDWVVAVRKDWMDELGLAMPTNEVEFRELLQAFKERDSEGRTVGMQVEGGQTIRRTMLPILSMFGVSSNFPNPHRAFNISADGTLEPIVLSENVKAALQYMNGLYADGLINTDFPSIPSFPALSETYWQAGKAGGTWLPNGGQFNIPDPKAEVVFIPPMTATGYEFARSQGLPTGGWISVSAESDNPQKAVDLIEFFNSREGRMLLTAGVEGLHYTSFDDQGNFERIQENWTYDTTYYPLNFYLGQGSVRGYIPVEDYDTFEEALAHVQIFEPTEGGVGLRNTLLESARWTGEPMPFQYIEFPELNDLNVALTDVVVTGWTEMITADPANFDAEWQEYLDEWAAAGADTWVQAYQDYYNEHQPQ